MKHTCSSVTRFKIYYQNEIKDILVSPKFARLKLTCQVKYTPVPDSDPYTYPDL